MNILLSVDDCVTLGEFLCLKFRSINCSYMDFKWCIVMRRVHFYSC